MLVRLVDAVTPTCGGKAGALGLLLRAGLPVPDGVVVPFTEYHATVGQVARLALRSGGAEAARRAIATHPLPEDLRTAIDRALDVLGGGAVAVRSSAGNEDTARTSAAGQYESALAVQGVDGVAEAVRRCWASLFSPGAVAYRRASLPSDADEEPAMGVVIQRHVDADLSGVMFTGGPDSLVTIEASWGLGPSVVGGTVTPDSFRVTAHGEVLRRVGDKQTRLDRRGARLRTTVVRGSDRGRATLDDDGARRLARFGQRVSEVFGAGQDVEWAMTGPTTWLLQSRPITAPLPPPPPPQSPQSRAVLTGTPGSRGTATGLARVVRGPEDFGRVGPGDILICPWTDPGWTPLLRIAGGVVTETGGALSHAAIVARELHIPAVLGVPEATTTVPDAAIIVVDGSAGTVTTHG